MSLVSLHHYLWKEMLSALLIVAATVAVFAFFNVRSYRDGIQRQAQGLEDSVPQNRRKLILASAVWVVVVVVIVFIVIFTFQP